MSSSTGSGAQTPSGGNTLEQPSRMFGDTLHLHRSSNNATKQVDALDIFACLFSLAFTCRVAQDYKMNN